MNQKFEKLKKLLSELFQLDQPDLDFGLYRVMRARSSEINKFLDEDLLPQIRTSFEAYAPADKAVIQKELDKLIAGIKEAGMDPEQSPKVQELRLKISNEAVDIAELESEIYDHLHSFFRRYYSEGDFISKRVYKEGVYAIPYEGEEVKLHWANADQYYIKTSEYLRDYAFRLIPSNEDNPMRVHFRLVDASEGEHGNVKSTEDKNRVFILTAENFISEENNELVIRFEYRPATLTDWPDEQRGAKTKPPTQKELNTLAEVQILSIGNVALAKWISELGKKHIKTDGDLADYSRFLAHLNRYTARNTFDYFIHKDLGKFLNRELDFYIKNEVMHLDDIEGETVPRVEQYLSKIRVIRKIAKKIITFLAQLEDFQKKLWLKKKFVVETNYCITLDRVPESMLLEIALNDEQREEWIKLFAIDEIETSAGDLISGEQPGYSVPLTVQFLKSNNKLVLDTRFFSDDFKAQLIASIENFDEQMDGLLVHSENFQALNLLKARYTEKVNCVYIDPPYNTGPTEIVYKNMYKDSSWLSLISDRVTISKAYFQHPCCFAIAIDDFEMVHLSEIADQIFLNYDRNMIIVNHHPQGGMSHNTSRTHEYMLIMVPTGEDILKGKAKSGEIEYRSFALSGPGDNKSRIGRPNSFYAILVDVSTKRIIGFEPPPPFEAQYPKNPTEEGYERIYPISPSGEEKVWCRSYDSAILGLEKGEIVLTENNAIKLAVNTTDKRYNLMSNWTDSRYNAGPHGTALLASIIGSRDYFSYPKSLFTVIDSIEAMTHLFETPIILDYFAGSGTTGHATIALNREDDGNRKYILVEMGDYFDTVLKPRILKVIYSADWKDGKPLKRESGISHCIKYLRLESYEDTLNNLDLNRTDEQQSLLDITDAQGADNFKEQYMLRYLLDTESMGSASLLNIDQFTDPTEYLLRIKVPGSDESRQVKVDLIETFNYLIGLQIKHIDAPHILTVDFEQDGEGRLRVNGRIREAADGQWWFRTITGTTLEGRKILVIWRKRPGGNTSEGLEQDNLVLDEWFTKQGYSSKDSEFDLIYVNGTNNLENLKTPDDLWKVRLIEEEFKRLMFEDEGM